MREHTRGVDKLWDNILFKRLVYGMMTGPVSGEPRRLSKRLRARVALKRFFARMRSLVRI